MCGSMFLEDGNWQDADAYCEKVLDIDPENVQAYLGKLMANVNSRTKESLKNCKTPFTSNSNYLKIVRFGGDNLKQELQGYIKIIQEHNEADRIERVYQNACNLMGKNQPDMYLKAVKLFESVADYKDSAIKRTECIERAESTRKDIIYDESKSLMDKEEIASYESAIEKFETIAGWRNTSELIAQCKHGIDKINMKKEQERLDAILKAKAKKKKTIIVLSSITAIVMILVIMFCAVSINIVLPENASVMIS